MDKLRLSFEYALRLRERNDTIVLTDGSFDLLHLGHISFLQESAKLGFLWVALNIDQNIRNEKGKSYPINNFVDRAKFLSALECVSVVFPFVSSENFSYQISELRPDFYTKSDKYDLQSINKNKKASLKNSNTKIIFLEEKIDYKTSDLIKRIKQT